MSSRNLNPKAIRWMALTDLETGEELVGVEVVVFGGVADVETGPELLAALQAAPVPALVPRVPPEVRQHLPAQ